MRSGPAPMPGDTSISRTPCFPAVPQTPTDTLTPLRPVVARALRGIPPGRALPRTAG
ncbi:hypothetical protein AB0C76_38070 [Kitasatospora sp. NPDC048722]|uniref:hypothetical protein n=1 Tax=Kitasatospora sp. NPDC048722 TaxID=3155639 RepID=UPI0033C4838A